MECLVRLIGEDADVGLGNVPEGTNITRKGWKDHADAAGLLWRFSGFTGEHEDHGAQKVLAPPLDDLDPLALGDHG
jgi:hypothetical protein